MKQPEPNATAATTPRKGAAWLAVVGLRLAAALGLCWVVLGAWQYSYRSVRAEVIGTNAERLSEKPGFETIAQEQLRAAIRLAPENPENITRRAVLAIKQENQKARAGSVRSMSYGTLDDALKDLESTRESSVMPSNVARKLAEVSGMLSGVAAASGDEAKSKTLAEDTALYSVRFLTLQGKPYTDAPLFYHSAIRRSYQADRHDLVLFFFDHCRHYAPGIAADLGTDQQLVNRSRLVMGESPMMIADVTEQLMDRPQDPRLLGDLILAGTRYGAAPQAVRALELIGSIAPLSPEAQGYLDQLRAAAN
ncbi:hypothetical protein GC173_06255 [bacterium]|nr:hypothetical protein [bacterium]